jgi:phosphoribosyl 1,2-cyclic phosphodiesterase
MSARFAVLVSSSAGNSSYLDLGGHGVLIDFGVGPRKLVRLLDYMQISWDAIRAVVLTHLHTDHWKEPTLKLLAKTSTPLWCHPDHAAQLEPRCQAFRELQNAGLVYLYQANETCDLGPCRCTPFALWHDVVTFGFRFDCHSDTWSLGYAADLGSWAGDLVERLKEVDVLALEFNHDVQMQMESQRDRSLIERVLGDDGHLSNVQASKLLAEILRRSAPGRLRHVVPLHLSRQCNHPELVHTSVAFVREIHEAEFSIHPAHPACPTPWFELSPRLAGCLPQRNR